MAQAKDTSARPCRIFMCYRRESAQTAIAFKDFMENCDGYQYGNIWCSYLESAGNFVSEIPELIGEAEWIIFFVGKNFTTGFLDGYEINPDCVTAKELIAIEKARQKRKGTRNPLSFLMVNIDGGTLDKQCMADLMQLFLAAGIKRDDTKDAYSIHQNHYHSAEVRPSAFIPEIIMPNCAICRDPVDQPASKTAPIPKPAPEPGPKPDSAGLTKLENGNVLFGSFFQSAQGDRRPIEWLVLNREGDRILLISRYALDCRRYHDDQKPISWAESSLRQWLNQDFLLNAFTADERRLIPDTAVSVDHDPSAQDEPAAPTVDKVFLLSVLEAKTFFLSDMDRRCVATAYAKKKGAIGLINLKNWKFTCGWWLRSTRCDPDKATAVFYDGRFSSSQKVDAPYNGVRPAIWVQWPEAGE